ncbi:MAG: hypothetical protein BYD32DRAFT_403071 [Podila humilis]|nr:MAG: hypothetical protein BYD32DRAFT_403071 [Podila humilis]
MAWLSLPLGPAMRSFCALYQTSEGQHTGTSCRDHRIPLLTQTDTHTHTQLCHSFFGLRWKVLLWAKRGYCALISHSPIGQCTTNT